MKKTIDIIIIGCGPAGLTAAIYALRAGRTVAIIENSAPGGKLTKTHEVENYTGFNYILGHELATKMYDHGTMLGLEHIYGKVTNISIMNGIKQINCEDGETYEARAVIIATGTIERQVGVPGEIEYANKGVSYCAICDGTLYKGEVVAVIGGGTAAVEESIYLSKIAKKVHLIHRRQGFRADPPIVNKLKSIPNVELHLDYVLKEVKGENVVSSIDIQNVITNKIENIPVKCVFPYIGADPITNFVSSLGILNPAGYVVVNSKFETKIKGIFACGDVVEKELRQIATAVGDGAHAGQFAAQYVNFNY